MHSTSSTSQASSSGRKLFDTTPALNFDQCRSTKHFPVFDGLRACAVLMVVLRHCPQMDWPVLQQLQKAGQYGVDIFFVLSGFLITTLMLREPEDTPSNRLGRFYLRRILRIFPLYYMAVMLYWLLAHLSPDPGAAPLYDSYLPYFLTYCIDIICGLHPDATTRFGIAWSLGVEEKFYLLWPFVMIAMKPRKVFMVGLAVIAITCLWRLWLIQNYTGNLAGRLVYSFDVRMDGIMWGCLLACLIHSRRSYNLLKALVANHVVLYVSIGAFVIYATVADNASFWRYLALPVFASTTVASVVLRPGQAGLGILRSKPIAYIGVISYGIYIFHPACISAAKRVTGDSNGIQAFACLLLATGFSIAISALSFHFFESPFLAMKNRLRRRCAVSLSH